MSLYQTESGRPAMGQYFAGYTVDIMINGELEARREVIRWAGGTHHRSQ
jgi:hypothetical protein